MIERPSVCRIEWLTMRSNGSPTWRARFSRTRSNTTIVSWTEKPMTVSIAVTNRLSIWRPDEGAEDREDAHHHEDVVEQRDKRRGPHPEVAEAVGDPEQDPDRPDEDQDQRLGDQIAGDHRADRRQRLLLGDRARAVLERDPDLAELALGRQRRRRRPMPGARAGRCARWRGRGARRARACRRRRRGGGRR